MATYKLSTFFLAQGFFRKNFKLDFTEGSFNEQLKFSMITVYSIFKGQARIIHVLKITLKNLDGRGTICVHPG